MVYISNFTNQDYEVIRELGNNSQGGRTVYLAKNMESQEEVVIKKFSFPQTNAGWDGYKIHEKEINILQQLDHQRIPRYLDSFPTEDGFCLVQQYKNAPSLADRLAQNRDFKPEEIKKIAFSVLEILVYLQQRKEPVYHRDIKPENILVDDNLNAYLIDFGFARIDTNNSIVSSILIGGTIDFMPHEQIHENQSNRVNKSSDLYSLGLTLICLLSKTPSSKIGEYISAKGVNFVDCKAKMPRLHSDFMKWFKKMVAFDSKERFPDAKSALNQLQSIPVQGLSFSEKLGNGFTSSFTLINKNKIIFSVIFLGIVGIKVAPHAPYMFNQIKSEFQQIAEEKEKEAQEIAKQKALEDKRIAEEERLETKKLETERIAQRERLEADPIAKKKILEENRQKLFIAKKCPKCYLLAADLSHTDLKDANLLAADLEGADLKYANLSRADLLAADLKDANLSRADLKDANLKYTNLKGADLEDADLEDADLLATNLKDANLKYANLKGANLKGSDLEGANLKGANLKVANLKVANLKGADLKGADLKGADLSDINTYTRKRTDLSGANLKGADVSDADLSRAELPGAELPGANLKGAELPGANLKGANLTGANLKGANLTGANLDNANLSGSNLSGANLRSTDLKGANLKGANLSGANFKNIDLTNAIMPNGMRYEEWRQHQ